MTARAHHHGQHPTRHGGPGAAEENATKAAPKVKGQANSRMKHLSDVSGGGGEPVVENP